MVRRTVELGTYADLRWSRLIAMAVNERVFRLDEISAV